MLYSSGISTCDAFAMRPRQITPLRKVKEEDMTSVALESQTVATEYNGWTNRETWMVNLWLTNEECYYHQLQEILHDYEGREQAEELEQACRFIVERHDDTGLRGDLIGTVLARVDWQEIIDNNQ